MKRIQLDPNKLLGMRAIREVAGSGSQARIRHKAKAGIKAGVKLAPR